MKKNCCLEFNPYHDMKGKFSAPWYIRTKEHGSRSKGIYSVWKHKAKVKDGQIAWEETPSICGRLARMKHMNVRCWDGKVFKGGEGDDPIVHVGELTFGGFDGFDSASDWKTSEKVLAAILALGVVVNMVGILIRTKERA